MNYIEMLKSTNPSSVRNLQPVLNALMVAREPSRIDVKDDGFQVLAYVRFGCKSDGEDSTESRHNTSVFNRMACKLIIDNLYENAIEHMGSDVWEKRTFKGLPDNESVIDSFSATMDRLTFGDLTSELPDIEPPFDGVTLNESDIFVEVSLTAVVKDNVCSNVIMGAGAIRWVSRDSSDKRHRIDVGSSVTYHFSDGGMITADEMNGVQSGLC